MQQSLQVQEGLEDRLHVFAEECDSLEGFQILCDDSTAWSGVSAAAADMLRDEYPKNASLLFATRQDSSEPPDTVRALTRALASARWGAACSLRVPMQPPRRAGPHLLYDAANAFHTSAVMASAIDTCTLPFRLHPTAGAPGCPGPPSVGTCSMADLCNSLAFPAANIAAVGAIVPAVSVAYVSAAEQDVRLSARERRLQGLPALDQIQAPAGLVADGLRWFTDGWDPKEGAKHLLRETLITRNCQTAQTTVGCRDAGHHAESCHTMPLLCIWAHQEQGCTGSAHQRKLVVRCFVRGRRAARLQGSSRST